MRLNILSAALVTCAATILSLASPRAAGAEWDHRITLYGWGSNLDGDVRIAPLPTLSVRRSFSDTLSSLEFAAMAAYQARRNRWGLLIDAQAVNLSERARLPLPGTSARLKTELRGVLFSGSYRLGDSKQGYLDLIAGLRYWSIDTDVGIQLPPGTSVPIHRFIDRLRYLIAGAEWRWQPMRLPRKGAEG